MSKHLSNESGANPRNSSLRNSSIHCDSGTTLHVCSVDLQCHATNLMLKISPVACRQTENDLVSDAQRNAVLDCFCESRA